MKRDGENARKRSWGFGLGAIAGAAVAGAAVARTRAVAAAAAARAESLRGVEAPNGRNIVVLGAGFGGVTLVTELLRLLPPESGWTVTLVDRHNYHLFTPLLYHAATGLVDPTSILFPVRSLSHAPNFRFREGVIEGVSFEHRLVQLADGELSFDRLVIGLGGTTNFFGAQEQVGDALTLKSAADAISLRNRLIDAYERADVTSDADERRRCLTFVVVGGGATGVELMGAIRGLVYDNLPRQYPRISPSETRLILCEALPQILPGLPPDLATHAREWLRSHGVELRMETPVQRVDRDGLVTRQGEYLPSRTVVWAAGVKPVPVVGQLDVPRANNGRIEVDEFLQIRSQPDCYALGDAAAMHDPHTGKQFPPSAAVAVQQGKSLAGIVVDRLDGREAQPFRYIHRGELVSLGRHEAVAVVGGVKLTGWPAWITWRAFYLSQLMGFRNRLTVALDWSFAYAYQRDTVRLELPTRTARDELAEEAVAPAR